MRTLFIALLMTLTASTANAVTFLTAPDDFSFGAVPVGQSRQELLVFDTSHWNFTSQGPILPVGYFIRPIHFSALVALRDPFDHYDLSVVDCGPYSGPHKDCVNVSLTSKSGFNTSAEIVWEETFYELGVFPDGREMIITPTFHTPYPSTISYIPTVVPLPASLPLMIGGLGLLGWLRKR